MSAEERQMAALRAALDGYDDSGALIPGPSEVHALRRLLDDFPVGGPPAPEATAHASTDCGRRP